MDVSQVPNQRNLPDEESGEEETGVSQVPGQRNLPEEETGEEEIGVTQRSVEDEEEESTMLLAARANGQQQMAQSDELVAALEQGYGNDSHAVDEEGSGLVGHPPPSISAITPLHPYAFGKGTDTVSFFEYGCMTFAVLSQHFDSVTNAFRRNFVPPVEPGGFRCGTCQIKERNRVDWVWHKGQRNCPDSYVAVCNRASTFSMVAHFVKDRAIEILEATHFERPHDLLDPYATAWIQYSTDFEANPDRHKESDLARNIKKSLTKIGPAKHIYLVKKEQELRCRNYNAPENFQLPYLKPYPEWPEEAKAECTLRCNEATCRACWVSGN